MSLTQRARTIPSPAWAGTRRFVAVLTYLDELELEIIYVNNHVKNEILVLNFLTRPSFCVRMKFSGIFRFDISGEDQYTIGGGNPMDAQLISNKGYM